MATLRKRGNTYYADYRINGKRFRKTLGNSKKVAELALKDIEVKIAKNELGFDRKDETLKKLFEEYFDYSKINHKPGTGKRYGAILDNFKRFLETLPHINKISHLNPKIIEDYKSFRAKEGAHNKTINMEVMLLRSIFNLAKNWGFTKENPTEGVKMLKIPTHIMQRFLTKEECKKLLGQCNKWEYPIFFTFLNTGMRKGELLNLEWRDVDFDRKKIRIRIKDNWAPKTSEREIPINDNLFSVFESLKESSKEGYVFQDEKGQQIQNNRLRKRLIILARKCGLQNVTKLHTLRHTFASHLVMNGIDLPTVKKLLGHTDIKTTMIYSHLAEEHVDKAVEILKF
jgi:site-specific recombinase XerD